MWNTNLILWDVYEKILWLDKIMNNIITTIGPKYRRIDHVAQKEWLIFVVELQFNYLIQYVKRSD